MRICLDFSTALAQGAGIGRYTRELALALRRIPEVELTLVHDRQPLERLPAALAQVPRNEIPLDNKAWRLFLLSGVPLPRAWAPAAFACDLFHGPDVSLPVVPVPRVSTVHDLTAIVLPQFHTRLHRTYERFALPAMLRRATAILADSESTRRDLLASYRMAPGKISTVHLGVDHVRFNPAGRADALRRLQPLGIDAPYLLAVGTLEPRKNLARLLRAYACLEQSAPPLVLAGAHGWGDSPLQQLVAQLGLAGRVIFPGFVPDALLPDLYRAAQIFVYPSLYEGFGLPVLEAMACGTPVITSTTSSLPEIADDAARLVAPTSEEHLAEAMRALVADAAAREELAARGLAQAQRFTWERTAQATVEVYRRCLAGGGGR